VLPFAEIAKTAADQLDFARAQLRAYARAESPTRELDALAACAELVQAGHAATGGRTRRVPSANGDHLVTTWGPDVGDHLLLIGHYDTVWPIGRLPYVEDGDTIAGPGVYDMKSGLVVIEAALKTLAALGIPLARQTRLVVVADEEIGSPTGRAVVEEELAGAVAVLGFESPHPGGVLKSGRRGSTRVRLTVDGREAHAALDPDKGVSAIDELVDQLVAVRQLIPDDGTTLANVGTIAGGGRANVIAGTAAAELGLRFPTLEAEQRVLTALEALQPVRAGANVTVERLSHRPAWSPPEPNDLLERVIAIGAHLGQELGGKPAAGAGDTNLTGAAGVPTLDGFGPHGQGAHAPDESIVFSTMTDRIALTAALLASL
jgi:glutamate carboxypeptidase